jgi:hypothetical protein
VPRFVWVVLAGLLASTGPAQQRKPGVPDIPAMQALWAAVKAKLTGPNAQDYFEHGMQGAQLPYLYGVVLSSTPENQPRVLVIAMSDKSTPEVTLTLEPGHLKEKVRDRTEIMFKGVPTAFSKEPFRLTIETSETVRVHEPSR